MAYVPLHHKYRPQRFADVVGQSAVVQTLSNAICSDRIAPAYLFCGPRGTGKTSSARILAKSLNCVDGPTPEPCNQCDACTSITNGSSLDVIEIDAASNTGVDNIRELIERSQFAPVNCRYKVYVLDEVHMLSTAAFNALLKTLEEPPPQVVFVLATTDPQRVLPTVISRCQRFDFRRIPLESMVEHLQTIAGTEKIAIADPALELIAQIAQGGLRDAESLLDQLSLLPEQIEVENVWDLVGAVPERDLLALLDAVAKKDAQQVVAQLRHLMDNGKEPLILLQNLTGFYRDLLLAKTAPGQRDMVALTQPTWDALVERAPNYEVANILAAQRCLIDVEPLLKNTTQPRLWLEISLLNLLQADTALASQPTTTPTAPVAPLSSTVTLRPAPVATPPPQPPVQTTTTQATEQPTSFPVPQPVATPDPQPSKPLATEAPAASSAPAARPAATIPTPTTPAPITPTPKAPTPTTPTPTTPVPAILTAAILPGHTVAAHWLAVLDSLPFSKSALLKQHVRVQEETETKAVLALAPNMRAFSTRIRGQFDELEPLISRRLGRPIKLELVLGEVKPSSAPETVPPQPVPETAGSSLGPASSPPVRPSGPPPVADIPTTPAASVSSSDETLAGTQSAPGRSPVEEPDILDRASSRLADFFSGTVVNDSTKEEDISPAPAVRVDPDPSNTPTLHQSVVPPIGSVSPTPLSEPVQKQQPAAVTAVAAAEIPVVPANSSPDISPVSEPSTASDTGLVLEEDLEEDEYELPF
ncbi:MAG: DNA polymerase III subunit gamma/tau [Cyanobacteria bacterium P01_E01_bin.34]